ncbi:helix-turn-helix transcriptional regulator [Bdellovibrio bacteriovorus]|uniref:helix-turn-helix transcriptional regulator n=1 Tax=Bdellovibrio bacteriovorus TaxID=959 RepID=UPI0035A605F5
MNLVKSKVRAIENDDRFTPEELCALWKNKVSVGTLANWRVAGKGPKFTKIGREILYRRSDVEAYEESQTASSTSHFR